MGIYIFKLSALIKIEEIAHPESNMATGEALRYNAILWLCLQLRCFCIPNAQNMPKAVKQRLCVKVKTLAPLVLSAKIDEKI